jgi:ribonuclease HI
MDRNPITHNRYLTRSLEDVLRWITQVRREGAGVLFISLEGRQLKYVLKILWQATNNEAEYEALIHGLRIVTSLGIKRLLVYGDLAVVINQVNKDRDCTKNNMNAYYAEV